MNSDSPQDQPWPLPYERPNQKWQCGRTDHVFPCPLGPDGKGRCRTTSECSPILEKKPGDATGRYRCTRRAEFGGPCSEGPLPSGACSHQVPPCAPIRSLRSRRALFTFWVSGLTIAALLLIFYSSSRYDFANPGPLSSVHSQPKGTQAGKRSRTENCHACHRQAGDGLGSWAEAAAGANPHPLHFASLLRPPTSHPSRMDAACAECHRDHQLHHVNLKQEQSCLGCHQEHYGNDALLVKTSQQCVNCHGDKRRMDKVSAGLFTPTAGVVSGRAGDVITRFSKDHPEFRPIASKAADPNTLRFNHQLHLSAPVVGDDGRSLPCAACHQQDAAGEYHQRIRFEQHCQKCHSLQFDPEMPDLQLPHGNVEFVKAFLASLPQQYAQYGERARGLTEKRALNEFVNAQMRRVQEQQINGASLEESVFFSRSRRGPQKGNAVPFYGCAYCHEVSGRGNTVEVIRAEVPARWLTRGAFQHREHQNVNCKVCHNAAQSKQTSDILLPSVAACATCHRSNAAPGENCTLCHDYHRWSTQLEARIPRELGIR